MHNLSVPKYKYSDPWDDDLHSRLKKLSIGEVGVAYYYETANNSTFRYRAYNMVQVINESPQSNVKNISASYFFQNDLHKIDEIVILADILVICRSGLNAALLQLIEKFKSHKKKIYFDIDDLVFDVRYAGLVINTLGQDINSNNVWDYWYSYMARMGQALLACDEAITTNEFLAEKISGFSNLPVTVVPNFMNKEQISYSEVINECKGKFKYPNEEIIKLGYFSGSPSHRLDYEVIRGSVNDIMGSYDNVGLAIAGYMDESVVPSEYRHKVEFSPFVDYVNLQRLIASVDYNLMPLQNNEFTNCKSELKYFEAGVVGVVSIASPVFTYKNSIEHGVNGYISRGHEWFSTIESILKNRNDYFDVSMNAYRDCVERYSWLNYYDMVVRNFINVW